MGFSLCPEALAYLCFLSSFKIGCKFTASFSDGQSIFLFFLNLRTVHCALLCALLCTAFLFFFSSVLPCTLASSSFGGADVTRFAAYLKERADQCIADDVEEHNPCGRQSQAVEAHGVDHVVEQLEAEYAS